MDTSKPANGSVGAVRPHRPGGLRHGGSRRRKAAAPDGSLEVLFPDRQLTVGGVEVTVSAS
ncbi:DUF6631 family protein [Pseudomonas aeruginosa]|uniref:DUF6631 family protein n=1 Tax=Pseudomonas aeruginosa TaxID=287 RepID=UPI0032B022F6